MLTKKHVKLVLALVLSSGLLVGSAHARRAHSNIAIGSSTRIGSFGGFTRNFDGGAIRTISPGGSTRSITHGANRITFSRGHSHKGSRIGHHRGLHNRS
ncbi:MAG: hypothetical protein ACYTBV_16690, partial [Planctomycetota bacterium]